MDKNANLERGELRGDEGVLTRLLIGARAADVSAPRPARDGGIACSEREQRLLVSLLRSLDFPLYVIDANTYEIVLANAQMCRNEPPWGATCHSLTHHRDSPCSGTDGPCPLEAVRRTKRPVVVEHCHYDADGALRCFEVHAVPVFDSTGRVSEVIEYNIDVTERRRGAEKLREHERSLELLVEQLEASNNERSTFASIATHELPETLQSIAASAAELEHELDGHLNDAGKRALEILTRGIERLRATITSLNRR